VKVAFFPLRPVKPTFPSPKVRFPSREGELRFFLSGFGKGNILDLLGIEESWAAAAVGCDYVDIICVHWRVRMV